MQPSRTLEFVTFAGLGSRARPGRIGTASYDASGGEGYGFDLAVVDVLSLSDRAVSWHLPRVLYAMSMRYVDLGTTVPCGADSSCWAPFLHHCVTFQLSTLKQLEEAERHGTNASVGRSLYLRGSPSIALRVTGKKCSG